MAAAVLRWYLDGKDEDECHWLWARKASREEDPSWPYDDADWRRHFRHVPAMAAKIFARQAAEAERQAAVMRQLTRSAR